MARSLGTQKRGRKKEPFRLAVEALASTVTNPGGTFCPTVEVQVPEREAETLDYNSKTPIPKGSVVIDHSLTVEKTATNIRELTRLALAEAGFSETVALHREHFASDPIAGERGYEYPKGSRNRPKEYDPDSTALPLPPESDSWALVPKSAASAE